MRVDVIDSFDKLAADSDHDIFIAGIIDLDLKVANLPLRNWNI